MPDKTHRLAAIVFTDIVGYTKRMEENESKTMQLLQQQREIIFPLVESYGGEVIKEIGDGLMMMFDSAVQAVRFAITVQTRLKEEELTIRAGIHIGDVIFKDGDVFGSAVNTAARIEPLASPNGICISDDVRTQLHNKSDIITYSRGKKELKGVSEPVEIFEIFIEGVSEKRTRSASFIFKDLWRRNVIQIMLGYIVSAWIIKQAVAAIITQYMLSPHLIELTWILLISLLPTVALLAYFHGKRSSGKWTRIELFGLPINIGLSIVMLVVLFNGKDLGAATEKVIIENEDGELITREILKNEFRKDITLFFFENESGNKQYDWMQYGIATLFVYDISQDPLIDATNGMSLINKFRDDGNKDGLGAPLMLKNKIAAYYHTDFFATGSFNQTDGNWEVTLDVYNTFKGSKIESIQLVNTDIFQLADDASVAVKKAVGLSQQQIDNAKDLPVAEIFTSSVSAFEAFIRSTIEVILNNDYAKGIEYAENAVKTDQDFALANMLLGEYYFNNNAMEKATEAIDRTMDKLYKLPERNQFYAKFFYYILRQEPDQALSVVKMWTDLYPYDINAKVMLAQRYSMKSNYANSAAIYKEIMKMVPEEYEYLRTLADVYELMGNYDSSLYYYSIYQKKFPNDPISYKNLGDTYLKFSDFDKAMKNYKQARLIDPENASTALKIARVHMITGEFEQAEKVLLTALPDCTTTQDSINIYTGLEGLSDMLGKARESFDYFQEKFVLYEKIVPPLRLMVLKTFMIGKYILVDKEEEALSILQNIESQFKPPLDKVSAFGYLFYYIDTRQPEKAADYIPVARDLMHSFGEEMLEANVFYAEGRISELNGRYEEAIIPYKSYLAMQPADSDAYRWIARCYYEAGKLDKARTNIEEALKRNPNHPKTLYEGARIYAKDKNPQRALELIKKANAIWQHADVIYEPAQKARSFRMELDGA